ncbi:ABC transporter permease [Methylovirgula ligni]|uniref:NitT/TauT family transport system permease protein n=1 Tax=Methylovirgula ligni TaxID=569860 RepID=A0A3D9YTW0_9HYPH|nr:ABC transporter permease [Methylovirgula ligni]QAY96339.1 ABC transporter permease [Methylovirgula ligni]REF85945.1 NitT/TauT family transport system permease protein [Methylovirgula ligni]
MGADVASTAPPKDRTRGRKALGWRNPFLALGTRRALTSIAIALLIWEIGSTSGTWLGHPLPILGVVPSPVSVAVAWSHLIGDPGYWQSWYLSFLRVLLGFSAAVVVGIPFGLLLAINKTFRGIAFPVFELLRPIPPLAWVPASVIFWPTQELSIDFVIFLGAFYTIVLNVVGGARAIDIRLIQVARSMGASRGNIFRRIILPAVLPSICTGMEVGIGITWEVVIAAEMISGGGGASGGDSSAGGGLGFFIWNSYIGGSYPDIIVGMFSIGIAGYLSSAAVRLIEDRITPWRRLR